MENIQKAEHSIVGSQNIATGGANITQGDITTTIFNSLTNIEKQYIVGGNIRNEQDQQTLSEITNQPFNFTEPTKSFVGREHDLQEIHDLFFVKNNKMVVICGCGGYGKTELARKFVQQYKQDNASTHILWMEAETSDKLQQSFQDLATWLHMEKIDNVKFLAKRIYQHLESSSYIIVFDNAVSRKQLLDFMPMGTYHCLITSHLEDWEDVPSVKLDPLPVEDAVNVLRQVLGKLFNADNIELYKELANSVSCVPLALQVTAAYVRQEMRALKNKFILYEFVQQVKKSFEKIMNRSVLDSNAYDNTISKAVELSFKKIESINDNISNLALKVLYTCSYLYSDEILHSDLLAMSYLKEFLKDSNDLERACLLLSDYSFICNENEKITIHRLVQITIIFLQKDVGNLNHYYKSCLEILLLRNDNSERHRNSILQHAEKHLSTFLNFYSEYKSKIITDASFLYNLIFTGCEIYLKEIFDEMNSQAIGIIDKHWLLHHAALYKQHGVLEFLLKLKPNVNQRTDDGRTALNFAAELLDLNAVGLLTKNNADVNVVDNDGDLLLTRIIRKSGEPVFAGRSDEVCEVLRCLRQHGASTEADSKTQVTLLHAATFYLSVDLIPFLVDEFSQNVNSEDIHKRTPLYYVSMAMMVNRERRLRTAACLIKHGAHTGHVDENSETPAAHARSIFCDYLATHLENPSTLAKYTDIQISKHADKLKALMTTGRTSDLTEEIDKLGEDAGDKINEYCLLHEAAMYKDRDDMVALLLERGADVNNRGVDNITALHVAATTCNKSVMQMLISRGADVNAIAKDGSSVLHYFILNLKVERQEYACDMLRWLVLECGAHTNIVTENGETLLHTASYRQRIDIINCLIHDFSFDVNIPDKFGQTPVLYVIFGMYEQVVDETRVIKTIECLIEHGALFHVNAINYANEKGLKKLAAYLENTDHNKCLKMDLETFKPRQFHGSAGSSTSDIPDFIRDKPHKYPKLDNIPDV